MPESFSRKVDEINSLLRSFGREAVQEIKMMKDGQVIGQVRYGYKPQYVFDAVNEVLQPENWRYEIVSKEIFDFQAVAEARLFVRIADEWICKGSHTGQMNIVNKNVGDAYKGAITDALQKCFSLLSIGQDAYRGLLKGVYLGNHETQPPVKQFQPSQSQQHRQSSPPEPQPEVPVPNFSEDLPKIAGVAYQRRNGRIIATGDTYNKRELMKSSGFRWDGTEKNWYKDVAVH